MEIKDLQKDDVFILDDVEYKVKNIEVSKVGKHGRAKVRLEVVDANHEEKVLIRVSTEKVEKK